MMVNACYWAVGLEKKISATDVAWSSSLLTILTRSACAARRRNRYANSNSLGDHSGTAPLAKPPARPTGWRNRPSSPHSILSRGHAEMPRRRHRPRQRYPPPSPRTRDTRRDRSDAHLQPCPPRVMATAAPLQIGKQFRLVLIQLHRIGHGEQFADQFRRVTTAPQIDVVETTRVGMASINRRTCRGRALPSDTGYRNRSSPAAIPPGAATARRPA